MDIKTLEKTAAEVRIGIVKAIHNAGSGHPGGSLSAADIVTALYFDEMNVSADDPGMKGRDKFILSKGHAGPVQYAALALKGYFPMEDFMTLRKMGSKFQGHPDMRKVPGIEMSTGSLGQGFSVAGGMAVANKLDNMVAILDHNGLQIDGRNEDVMTVAPVADKFEAFGWNVISIDGHDFAQILDAFRQARECKGRPTMIIAETVKGKGVSFMENNAGWHGKAPNDEETEQAVRELGGEL